MKTFILILALVCQTGLSQAILFFSGASSIEELSADEIGRYNSMADHPLDLNLASMSRITATGLLSRYQAASFIDYRNRTGDVLSWAELALVDGFSKEICNALMHFAVLDSSRPPGSRRDGRYSHTLTSRVSASLHADPAYRLSYHASIGHSAELNLTTPGTFSAAYYGRRHLGKVVVGHFNARFGQGLAQWSGFSLSSLSTIDAFSRRGTGFSPSGGSSPELFGIAADASFGRFSAGAAYDAGGGGFIVSGCGSWSTGTLGMTACPAGISADWRFSLPGIAVSGELATDWNGRVSAVASAVYTPVYGTRIALRARWMDESRKDWSDLSAGFSSKNLTAIVSAGMKQNKTDASQYRALVTWTRDYVAGAWTISPSLRVQERFRPADARPLRSEFRALVNAALGQWSACCRYDFVTCGKGAHLFYAEGSYSHQQLQVFLRSGIFCADEWDERIYVYERDAPGTFNVPAYYGRGWNMSLYGGWKINRRHSLWLRLETVQYPWNMQPKQAKAGARLQYRWKI